jgi:putative flippase GtrA
MQWRARFAEHGRLLGRHQVAAAAATAVDFGGMIALVEGFHFDPGVATLLSAAAGAVTNFLLARTWAFRQLHTGTASSQALRYALISAGGALLNATLLHLVLRFVDVPYPLVRAVVAVGVGLTYNYPLHRRVVFRVSARPAEDGTP